MSPLSNLIIVGLSSISHSSFVHILRNVLFSSLHWLQNALLSNRRLLTYMLTTTLMDIYTARLPWPRGLVDRPGRVVREASELKL